jgi:quinoprotein glucose dehydrogenase
MAAMRGIERVLFPWSEERETLDLVQFLFMKKINLRNLSVWIVAFGLGMPSLAAATAGHAEFVHAMQQLELADGYEISLYAAEPDVLNPIALSVDESGRVYLAETDRYRDAVFDVVTQKPEWLPADLSFRTVADRTDFLKREFKGNLEPLTRGTERVRVLWDVDGDGKAERSTVLADGFSSIPTGPAAGLLAHRGRVWFQCLPGLWRIDWSPETNQRHGMRQLHEGFGVHVGVSGHDLHGITWGPEGRLYFSMGDRGLHVETPEGTLHYPDTGAVLRCEPDGSNLEVVAYGLRNPQEIVFDPYGNLFAGDNDTSGADKSRILHIVPHGDYGWRCSYQHMQGFGPWVQESFWKGDIDDMLPSTGYISQGPSGFALHPEAGAEADMAGPFFICDFPGGIRSFDLRPNGATFAASDNQKWLWNLWATDLVFGPDGVAYVTDWVAGWQQPEKGRVYQIKAAEGNAGLLGADVRPVIWSMKSETRPEQLGTLLSHRNQWVRREAQFRLVDLGEVSARVFVRTLSENESVLARLHAVWGLSQLTRTQQATLKAYYQHAAKRGLNDSQPSVRSATLQWISDVPALELWQEVEGRLDDADPSVVMYAALTLSHWLSRWPEAATKSQTFLPRILAGLEETSLKGNAHLRHGFHVLLSRWIQYTKPVEAVVDGLRKHHSESIRLAMLQAARRLKSTSAALFLSDASPQIRDSAVRAIYDQLIDDALPILLDWTPPAGSSPGTYRRWLWAHYQVGGEPCFRKLVHYLAGSDVEPELMETEIPSDVKRVCFEVLRKWGEGTSLDPVTGLWRPVAARSTDQLETLLKSRFAILFSKQNAAIHLPLLDWLTEGTIEDAVPYIANLLDSPDANHEVRAACLKALITLDAVKRTDWLRAGLESGVESMQSVALAALSEGEGDQQMPALFTLLEWFKPDYGIELRQSVVKSIARMNSTDAKQVTEDWWLQFRNGTFPDVLKLELIESVRGSAKPERLAWWRSYRDEVLSKQSRALPLEVLHGGNVERGRAIFRDRADVACMRCHRAEGEGGVVGPDLDRLSERLTRNQILESVLYPNAAIAPGYASERFFLSNDEDLAGVVLEESGTAIRLRMADGSERNLAKERVEQRVSALSAMPEGVAAGLKPGELRDLMAYLSGL